MARTFGQAKLSFKNHGNFMTNIELSQKIIQSLMNQGVHEFCFCAGARNSPLVFTLEKTKNIRLYSFFEERSAAFFALGRMQKSKRPVVVVTTSGTAVAELLPAAIEAYYTQKPLILLTADRPPFYRGRGTPQTIEQPGIFSHYVEESWDIFKELNLDFSNCTWTKPLHLNVCFDEPLIDAPVVEMEFPLKAKNIFQQNLNNTSVTLKIYQNPLVIVSGLDEEQEKIILPFLEQFKGLIYAESLSNLHRYPQLKDKIIQSGEKFVHWVFTQRLCESVIAIGGVPTLRFWRDLEESFKETPVCVVNSFSWTGLARASEHVGFANVTDIKIELDISRIEKIKKLDQEKYQQLEQIFQKFPLAEPSLFYQLGQRISQSQIYLGNSLPIREWDLAAAPQAQGSEYFGNRGANGIDGQLSTFLGWCDPQKENWCVVGDLTTMYDLVSLWATDYAGSASKRIVIINNQGGQIFDRMFRNDLFINKHQMEFSHWAAMWKWSYEVWREIPSQFKLAQNTVIEIQPQAEQTKMFWESYNKIWTMS